MLSDSQKIGVALTSLGVFFMFLGVISFFDGGLLAIGNILFVTGIPVTIGIQRTIGFFSQKSKIRGSICFLVGISLVFCRWTIIGMLIELFGIVNLYGDFFPMAFAFLRQLPIIGSILRHPGVEKILSFTSNSPMLPV
ncbi:vesicle transport protein [Absidia repens]|uniref:Vesicle transport protein n=1 Tax=Absidia repens TaxID=90262 RepID=A0A1X2IYI6_9FUNG|nr:vesicle transport protein [Absidia repens]